MRSRQFAYALLGVAALALVAALPAAAKEGVQATLRSSIPLDAPAGTKLKVAWRLFYVQEHGPRRPFGANGVFVRLISASGAAAEGTAPTGPYRTGEYAAPVVVPEGGIADVEVGLMGWQSGEGGTRRADALFPITNDPLPGARAAASASGDAGTDEVGTDSTTWVVMLVASLALASAALAVARRASTRRRRAPQPAEQRPGRADRDWRVARRA